MSIAKRTALIVALLVALSATACGRASSTQQTGSPTTIARTLAHEYASRGTLSHVVCVERSDREYRCEGDFTPNRAAVEASMKGVDTSGFEESDWQALVDQDTGPLVLDVSVGRDGSWVATPVQS